MAPKKKPSPVADDDEREMPSWIRWAGSFIERVGFPGAVAVTLLIVVFYGPHSAASFATQVKEITNANERALKDLGLTIKDAVKEAVGTSAASVATTDAALRQMANDMAKVREDTARVREAVTVIQVEMERAKK